MRGHRLPPRRRPLAAAVAAGAVLGGLGVAACGSAAPGGVAAGGVCGQAGEVSGLVVTRVDPSPGGHPRFTFPAKVAVSGAGKARPVAVALCALPAMPKGSFSCGTSAFGGWYRLDFTAGGKKLAAVRLDSTCEKVSGAGQVRWVARTPGFWQVLGSAMGLSHPDMSTFLAPSAG